MSRRRSFRILLKAASEQPANRAASPPVNGEIGLSRRTEARTSVTVVALERAAARQHFVEHAAERPDVGALVDALAARLLRAHVRGRAHDDARAGRRGVVIVGDCVTMAPPRRSGSSSLGQAEVEHLDRAVGRDLDVGRLQVAMDDALLVRRLERLGDLPGDGQRFVQWKRPLRDAVGERRSFDQLQDERADALASSRP